MDINIKRDGSNSVVYVSGEIDLYSSPKLREAILDLFGKRQQDKVVVNLTDVPYIDSAGLGEIVRTYTTVSRQGGQLKLLNLTKRITDLLAITKLLTVFETYDSEADAVRSFSSSARV